MAWPGVLLTKQDTENYRRRQKKYAACDRHLHKQPREVTASVVRGGWIFQVSKDRFVRNDIINQTCCLSIQEEPNCCCCPEDWEAWAGCLPRPTGKPPGQMEQAPWYHHAGAHSRPDSIAKLCNHQKWSNKLKPVFVTYLLPEFFQNVRKWKYQIDLCQEYYCKRLKKRPTLGLGASGKQRCGSVSCINSNNAKFSIGKNYLPYYLLEPFGYLC